MSANIPPFPVTREDIAESIAASVSKKPVTMDDSCLPPKRPTRTSNPSTAPGSATGTPPLGRPPLGSSQLLHVNCASLSPSRGNSRRASISAPDTDSRRSSVTRLATDAFKDVRKGVRNVTDTTKKATHRVKDKTAGMGAHMKVATVGASKWVADQTSRRAKAAMDQARSGLSLGEKFTLFAFEKISVLSRRGFTHVFMLVILIGYTALGAMLFIACEAPHEEREKVAISEERILLIESLWNKKSDNFATFVKEAKVMFEPYEDQLYKSFTSGVTSDTDDRVWTFWKAMFFCSTITTTIGYGHITPKTKAGQALTIVYALIGIPIFLILMADFGKLFTRLLKNLFLFIRRVYRSGTCVKARKHPRVQRWRQSIRVRTPSHSSTGNLESVTTVTDLEKSEADQLSEAENSDEDKDPDEIKKFKQRVLEARGIRREVSATELQKVQIERKKIPVSQSVPQHLLNGSQLEKVKEESFEEGGVPSSVENIQNNENETIEGKAKRKHSSNSSPELDIIPLDGHLNGHRVDRLPASDISQKATGRWEKVKNFLLCRRKVTVDAEEGVPNLTEEETPKKSVFVVGSTGSAGLDRETEEDYFSDGNFNLPISLALVILIVYMIIGCIIYISWEEWGFFEAFYFIFVSMTTIGFGDYVPEHPAFMMATALYLVFGLALTAMCINIIQEKLTHTFNEASAKLKISLSKIMASQEEGSDGLPIEGKEISSPIIVTPAVLEKDGVVLHPIIKET